MKYTEKDISLIIVTYNRPKDLDETLKKILKLKKLPREILVIDQSEDDKTKKICEKFKNKKIKYFHSSPPSITIARNFGVKKADKRTKLIFFIDDDVDLSEDYLKKILEVFNQYPETKASGTLKIDFPIKSRIENFLRKVFYLRYENKTARIISAYGNTYPRLFDKIMKSDYLQGVNMAYKKEVFEKQKFDENLPGYTVAEDIDFSYRLSRKYPNSILITPHAKLKHRNSQIERAPTKIISYINQVDHFYFYFKNLNNSFKNKLIFAWSLFGILFLRLCLAVFKPSKKNIFKFWYFLKSVNYCLLNIKKIKKGKIREWQKKYK